MTRKLTRKQTKLVLLSSACSSKSIRDDGRKKIRKHFKRRRQNENITSKLTRSSYSRHLSKLSKPNPPDFGKQPVAGRTNAESESQRRGFLELLRSIGCLSISSPSPLTKFSLIKDDNPSDPTVLHSRDPISVPAMEPLFPESSTRGRLLTAEAASEPEDDQTLLGGVEPPEFCSSNHLPGIPDQSWTPDPSERRRTSSGLSHSAPSPSQILSTENTELQRAASFPDLKSPSSLEEFTPDVTDDDDDDETFRFQCSAPGLYQCRETSLVFDMKAGGDVVYRIVPWNRRSLSQHRKKPAGPLFDISCEQQSVCGLHLPHCEVPPTGGRHFLSVAHVDDEGLEFITPEKITETHVIIKITGFSAFGNVKDEGSPPDPVRALVLLFYKPPVEPDSEHQINVLMLPKNVPLWKVLHFRKKLDRDEMFLETPPHCKLHPKQVYSLSIGPGDDSVLVQPTEAEFDEESYDNYFPTFQAFCEKLKKSLKVCLKDSRSNSVWERRVCLSSSGAKRSCGPTHQNLGPNEQLSEIRIGFISGISEPVLKSLLDRLLEKNVVQDCERDAALAEKEKGDKARFVIDAVRKKGDAASSEMIDSLCELDPFFSEHLGLM